MLFNKFFTIFMFSNGCVFIMKELITTITKNDLYFPYFFFIKIVYLILKITIFIKKM